MAEAMIVDEDENDDFPVKELWGLDHHFKSCLKLYISEILAAPYNNPYLGVFAYRNHPFQKVDITGIVVGVDERTKCHTYIVDDGTGVITCVVWNNQLDIERQQYGKYKLPGLLVKKLDELSVPVVYELGDCIQVCGKVKVFKNMREIVSTYTKKITDPCEELFRIKELPNLHTKFYDKPFVISPTLKQQLLPS